MLAGLRRRVVSRPRRALEHAPDAGFTLTEVLVAMMLIGVVMGALTTFYVNSMSIMNHQRGKQTAIQLASSGVERVRALKASDLATAPASSPTATPCSTPVPVTGVDVAGLQQWDDDCPSLGISYHRYWYVGKCWQQAGRGECTGTTAAVELFRVVVAVTWSDKNCQSSACTYATSTMVSGGSDPLFTPGTTTPINVTKPNDQTGEVDVAVPPLTVVASGGAKPLTFAASGLPVGLSMDSSGVITGTPTKDDASSVTVIVTDDVGNTGRTSFTWTIVPLPQLVNPGTQRTTKGAAVSLRVALTGGTAPFTWSAAKPGPWGATGLPPGLSIDTRTGTISGTPTKTGPLKDVTVTVTDKYGKSASAKFGWTVVPAITSPANRTDRVGTCVNVQATADGTGPYTWSYTDLPDGLTMSSSGLITGCLAHGTRYLPTITVRDATGEVNTLTFEWKIDPYWWDLWNLWRLQVTDPTGDRTDRAGQSVNVPLHTNWGWAPGAPTWTGTGLPPGVQLKNGALTGAPTQAGTYMVRLDVHETFLIFGDDATFMFTWTVQ
jgi:prepilin-type N-terminal cleavage/methylation domain-containing protein